MTKSSEARLKRRGRGEWVVGPGHRLPELVAKIEELVGERDFDALREDERHAIIGRAFEALGVNIHAIAGAFEAVGPEIDVD